MSNIWHLEVCLDSYSCRYRDRQVPGAWGPASLGQRQVLGSVRGGREQGRKTLKLNSSLHIHLSGCMHPHTKHKLIKIWQGGAEEMTYSHKHSVFTNTLFMRSGPGPTMCLSFSWQAAEKWECHPCLWNNFFCKTFPKRCGDGGGCSSEKENCRDRGTTGICAV